MLKPCRLFYSVLCSCDIRKRYVNMIILLCFTCLHLCGECNSISKINDIGMGTQNPTSPKILICLFCWITSLGPYGECDSFKHELRGVIPRSFEHLFNLINREQEMVCRLLLFIAIFINRLRQKYYMALNLHPTKVMVFKCQS